MPSWHDMPSWRDMPLWRVGPSTMGPLTGSLVRLLGVGKGIGWWAQSEGDRISSSTVFESKKQLEGSEFTSFSNGGIYESSAISYLGASAGRLEQR